MKFVYEAPSTNLVVLKIRRAVLSGSNPYQEKTTTGEGVTAEDGEW